MNGNNYWYLNANNGLGSGAAYSSWNEGYAFLVMPQMHIKGNATLSFDYLIGTGNYNESCSVVVSTNGMTFNDFSEIIWTAEGNYSPSVKANAMVSLSDYDNQDIYIAFKFKGSGTSGCTWYIDNVEVYVTVEQTIELAQGWNWWTPSVESATLLNQLETGLGANGVSIISKDESVTNDAFLGWMGTLTTIEPGKMYKIQTTTNCTFIMSGRTNNPSNHLITINKGYNWIGFTGLQSESLTSALSSLEPEDGDVIMDKDNSSTYYESLGWIGNVTTLEPGKGYMYKSNSNEAKSFHF